MEEQLWRDPRKTDCKFYRKILAKILSDPETNLRSVNILKEYYSKIQKAIYGAFEIQTHRVEISEGNFLVEPQVGCP